MLQNKFTSVVLENIPVCFRKDYYKIKNVWRNSAYNNAK